MIIIIIVRSNTAYYLTLVVLSQYGFFHRLKIYIYICIIFILYCIYINLELCNEGLEPLVRLLLRMWSDKSLHRLYYTSITWWGAECEFFFLYFFFFFLFSSNFYIISFLDKNALSRYSTTQTSVEVYIRKAPVSQPLTPLYPSCLQSSVSLPMYINVSSNSIILGAVTT